MTTSARIRSSWRSYMPLVIVALLLTNGFVYASVAHPPRLTVQVLSVAKGEAFLVRTPGGTTMLIDTGADAGILRELGAALPFWQRRINVLIITSTDKSAGGGALAVMQRYHVRHYLTPTTLRRGMRISLGKSAVVDVLAPDRTIVSGNAASRAVALRLTYDSTSFIFDGMLSPKVVAWFQSLDAHDGAWQANVTFASTTPSGIYYSNGLVLTKN